MTGYYLAISLTVFAQLSYHFCQKSIDPQADPFVSMIATYFVAIVTTMIAAPFFSKSGISISAFRQLNWASYGLGFAIFTFELGFLFAYRTGWSISTAALYSNALTACLLIPIGLLAFREKLTLLNTIGIVLAIVGILLMSKR